MGGLIGAGLFEVTEPTGMNGRSNRQEDLNPPMDDIALRLQGLTWAQEAVGEKHISMMQWSAQKYYYERVKVGSQAPNISIEFAEASDDGR